ncbi:sarcoplasmic reticulum histidine-rich calcium-binding protein-like isoform X3 [Eriocheir sinensis]|uniref:sarcoplasmic reticulum histidine-rich calcium-binding protein-like isoform X3 n=1 Tax=Eriocheir sinensis TaxID=95602 RepID=UPI0021C8F9D3|nr:sarcoplasmic reticulum histidine-rich calcium-binding protein-like isoform X3 [Eriocheir sinensis]
MNRVFPHSDRKGVDAALDIVESTLASLQKRVEKQQKGEEGEKRVKDAATNTTPPPLPPPSVTSSKASKKQRKSKSVLIKRKTHYKSKRPRNSSQTSTHGRLGTQVFEIVAEGGHEAPCTHCTKRPPEAKCHKSEDQKTHRGRRKGVTRPYHDPERERERVRVRRKEEEEECVQRNARIRYGRGEEAKEEGDQDLRVDERKVKKSHTNYRKREEKERNKQRHSSYRKREEEESDLDSQPVRGEVISRRPRKRGHSRRGETDTDLDLLPAQEKVIWKHSKGHRREDSDNDLQPQMTQEKVVWRRGRGHRERETDAAREKVIWRGLKRGEEPESDLDSAPAQEKVTLKHRKGHSGRENFDPIPNREKVNWRGLKRGEEPESDLDSTPTQEKVTLKHRKGHRGREAPEDRCHSCTCHREPQKVQRHPKAHSDPEMRQRVMWEGGRRGHGRYEGSDTTSDDSSDPNPAQKSHRGRISSSRPESLNARPRESLSSKTAHEHHRVRLLSSKSDQTLNSRPKYNTQGLSSDTGLGKQKKKVKMGGCECHEHGQSEGGKGRRQAIHVSRPHEVIDMAKQGYAQHTFTSRLRVDHSWPRRGDEKENIIHYIPCGTKSRSYHLGIIAQQEVGRLLSQPLQEHSHTHSKC